MAWPERKDVWPGGAESAREAVQQVVQAIAKYENVTVLASSAQLAHAKGRLESSGVRVVEAALDDIWLRDTGPTFLVRRGPAEGASSVLMGVSWKFNGWGGKFPPWDADAQLSSEILKMQSIPEVACEMILEGGGFCTDGDGTVLVTESCLLNPNRNPNLSRNAIEENLIDFLGVTKIIWLPSGLLCDVDTDGHVDNFACFGRPGLVLLAWCEDASDPQAEVCEEALGILQRSSDARGRKLEVVKLPLPPPMFYSEDESKSVAGGARRTGERIPGSYVNFYIANGGVIVPGFGGPSDEAAEKILTRVFPERDVVLLPEVGRTLALGGGNIHCITQQQPKMAGSGSGSALDGPGQDRTPVLAGMEAGKSREGGDALVKTQAFR